MNPNVVVVGPPEGVAAAGKHIRKLVADREDEITANIPDELDDDQWGGGAPASSAAPAASAGAATLNDDQWGGGGFGDDGLAGWT